MKNSAFLLFIMVLCSSIQADGVLRNMTPGTFAYMNTRDMILASKGWKNKKITQAEIHEIIPGLFLGTQIAAENERFHWEFSHILSVREGAKDLSSSRITWKGIYIQDQPNANISRFFDESYEFIESSRTGVLVHCRFGVSRSATIVIAYLMRKFDVPFDAAYNFVRSKRFIQPNDGFTRELMSYRR